MYYQVYYQVFTPDNTHAASFLNGLKNICSKECPFGIKTIVLLCKEEISIQEKQVDFKNSIMVILKTWFYSFGLHSSLSRVKEGWLKMMPKRKLNSENQKLAMKKKNSWKNLFQNQHDM